jgi:hypothetical protein
MFPISASVCFAHGIRFRRLCAGVALTTGTFFANP